MQDILKQYVKNGRGYLNKHILHLNMDAQNAATMQ